MKIKYVQLESDAFVTDIDFIQMSPAERGVYCSLILFLTSNDGKCPFDPAALGRLCNCEGSDHFEKIWEGIAKKFQTRNGVIKHKRVAKELRRAKKLQQAKRKAGLKGAQVTWQRRNAADGGAVTKGRKGNGIERENKENATNSNTSERAVSSSTSVRPQSGNPDRAQVQIAAIHFHDALVRIIRPRSQSDRTCFDNIRRWLIHHCAHGRFDVTIFDRVLGYAREAQQGRKPPAVFMALLKKELDYRAEGMKYV